MNLSFHSFAHISYSVRKSCPHSSFGLLPTWLVARGTEAASCSSEALHKLHGSCCVCSDPPQLHTQCMPPSPHCDWHSFSQPVALSNLDSSHFLPFTCSRLLSSTASQSVPSSALGQSFLLSVISIKPSLETRVKSSLPPSSFPSPLLPLLGLLNPSLRLR